MGEITKPTPIVKKILNSIKEGVKAFDRTRESMTK